MEQLEHPDITRVLRTGYPSARANEDGPDVIEVGEDEFEQIVAARCAGKGTENGRSHRGRTAYCRQATSRH